MSIPEELLVAIWTRQLMIGIGARQPGCANRCSRETLLTLGWFASELPDLGYLTSTKLCLLLRRD